MLSDHLDLSVKIRPTTIGFLLMIVLGCRESRFFDGETQSVVSGVTQDEFVASLELLEGVGRGGIRGRIMSMVRSGWGGNPVKRWWWWGPRGRTARRGGGRWGCDDWMRSAPDFHRSSEWLNNMFLVAWFYASLFLPGPRTPRTELCNVVSSHTLKNIAYLLNYKYFLCCCVACDVASLHLFHSNPRKCRKYRIQGVYCACAWPRIVSTYFFMGLNGRSTMLPNCTRSLWIPWKSFRREKCAGSMWKLLCFSHIFCRSNPPPPRTASLEIVLRCKAIPGKILHSVQFKL